jgi:putative glycerol-1-phosphate prenyltransferase
MNVFSGLMARAEDFGSAILVIVDPDKHEPASLPALGRSLEKCGVDGIMVGGTYIFGDGLSEAVRLLKQAVNIPVIVFPGGSGMSSEVVPEADAILFLTLISGRNPEYLIGEQMRAGLRVIRAGIESIPVGYMLLESEATRPIEEVTGTRALQVDKPGTGLLYAAAGQCMGLKMIYLDRGSGAADPVSTDYARTLCSELDIPVMVSGGLREANQISALAEVGVKIFAVGSVIEESESIEQNVRSLVAAAHRRSTHESRGKRR